MRKMKKLKSLFLLLAILFTVTMTTSNLDFTSSAQTTDINVEDDLSNYQVISSWGTNFNGRVDLEKDSDWTVEFDLPYLIEQTWNATRTDSLNPDGSYHYVFTPPSYGSDTFGFIAKGDGSILPTNFSIKYGGNEPPIQATEVFGYLTVKGNTLYDNAGNPVRITGVNWFGFETGARVVHGLWTRDYKSMLRQIKEVGFNTIRLPFSNAILEPGAMPMTISYDKKDAFDGTPSMNNFLKGKTSLEVLDEIISYAGKLGLRVILDNHSRQPDAYMQETLWYTDAFSEEQWINDWVTLAKRYKDNPVVVGFDLNNEPHDDATWGDQNPATDWNKAAERCGNAILEANPNLLIIVEGVEMYNDDHYWWGGNLAGVRDYPIQLSNPEKLVYSMHEYSNEVHNQDWFSAPDFPNNMPKIWTEHFGYIRDENIGHLLCGEFGIQQNGGTQKVWFEEFLKHYGSDTSWTFWCWNPNSGDTGGILASNWITLEQWKIDALEPYMAPLILGEEEN